MSRDITEQIDDICDNKYGHTSWVILSTLSDQEVSMLFSFAILLFFDIR